MTRKAKAEMPIQIEDGELMHIDNQIENWSECTLEDGTQVRIRPVITEVFKLPQLGLDGKPVFRVKSALITDVRHPKEMKTKKRGKL